MQNYLTKDVRNVVLLGHGGVGKTTMAEAMAVFSGAASRRGTVNDKNTISDFDPEEQKRGFSINTSVIPVEWNGKKINVLDTPGYFDFVGEAKEALAVADAAVMLVSGKAGVEVGTELSWEMLDAVKMPRVIFINGMDDPEANMVKVLEDLESHFGKHIAPTQAPLYENGKFVGFADVIRMKGRRFENNQVVDCEIPDSAKDDVARIRTMILETVAESSEELMERYFETDGADFTQEEILTAISNGILSGEVVPVLCGIAANGTGIGVLLSTICDQLPAPSDYRPINHAKTASDEDKEVKCADSEPTSLFVFKTVADPFFGKVTYFKVNSGVLKSGASLYNPQRDVEERFAHIYIPRGKEQIEVSELHAGDIGVVTKLAATLTCDTLCEKTLAIRFDPIDFPESLLCKKVLPKAKGDEEKISSSLARLMEEDLTLRATMDKETKEQQIFGIGDQHLDIIVSKLKNKFKLDVDLGEPTVSYRETIRGSVRVQGKHKKQSGGHGQYGDVWIRFEPSGDMDTPVIFAEEVFGGSVPKNYFPAVEKGLQECVREGILAGYPMVGLKATLDDGSYHPVDSSEMAFKLATSLAFKAGIPQCKPVLMEPISSISVTVPDEYMGDIMGDISTRRGRVLGMNHVGKKQIIEAEVPTAELFSYATDLRSMTQGRGYFTMSFLRYEDVPRDIQEKIVAAHKAEVKE